MSDRLAASPAARRLAVVVWTIAALGGSVAVWWLSAYIDDLTALARTDRDASLALFRTRVLPGLTIVVAVAVAAGVALVRQGLRSLRTSRFPLEGSAVVRTTPIRTGSTARALGRMMAITGFLLAGIPLLLLALVIWMLRQA